jgi:hypothetical protein
VESLLARADAIQEAGAQRLTDPMSELWLRGRGLVPAEGDDALEEE